LTLVVAPQEFYAVIGSVFGWSVEYGTEFHAGQDYPWKEGTEIPSPGAGRVVARGYTSAAGYYVTVLIDGFYFIFYHMKHWTGLQVGDQVAYGDVVGLVGTTGKSTGPHLHLAVSTDPRPGEGYRRNPLPIVALMITAYSLAASSFVPFPTISQQLEDEITIYIQPTNNSSPLTPTDPSTSRIWSKYRVIDGIEYSDVWGVDGIGDARRLTAKQWRVLNDLQAKKLLSLNVVAMTGNDLEQIVYAREL